MKVGGLVAARRVFEDWAFGAGTDDALFIDAVNTHTDGSSASRT